MLKRDEIEFYVEPHQMYAEGAHNDKPSKMAVELALDCAGYIASDIDIFYDDLQALWRWTADIAKSEG